MPVNAYGGAPNDEYLRSAWEWCQELEATTGGVVRVVLRPATRRRVWTVRTELCDVADSRLVAVRRVHKLEWPGANLQCFTGALWDSVLKLDQMGDTPIEQEAKRRP